MKQKFTNALSLALIFAMLFTSVALADNVSTDSDTVTLGDQATRNLGNVAPGANLTPQVSFMLVCAGNNHVDNPQSVSLSYSASGSTIPAGGSVSVSSATIGANGGADPGVPAVWPDDGSSCASAGSPAPLNDNGNSAVTLTAPTAPGSYTYRLKYDAVPTPAGSGDSSALTGSVFAEFTLTVVGDTTAPTITPSVSGTLGTNGWYTSNVEVSWTVSDPESTVTSTSGCGPSTVSTDTTGLTFTCSASSAGGSNSQSVTIKRDATAPSISGAASPAPNGAGWNNTDVAVTFSCSDVTSGVVSCGPNQTLSSNGADQSASGSAVDNAGNSVSTTVSNIDIDKELPTITASVPAANGNNGWYTGPVTATFNCTDAYSGVASCEPNYEFTGEGAQSHTGYATDVADNQNSSNVSVNIDTIAPVIALVSRTAANGNNWNNTDVALEWSCTDGGSGVVNATINQTVSTEGEGQTATATCEDLAGNTSSDTQIDINIDKTAPTASASRDPLANSFGWNNTAVTVSFDGTDGLSGIDSCSADVVLSGEGADQSASGTCTDNAGNVSAEVTASGINIDKTAPTASASASPAANGNGWNNTDVTVSFSGSDGLSGVASCAAAVVLSSEGAGQLASGTCTDKAGNVSSAATATVSIDKTAPSVSLVGGPANGGTYYFGFVPAEPTCSASDSLSGLDGSCSVSGYSNAVGTHTVSASATDKAGNSASAAATYTVNAWTINGFYQPVDMGGVWNTVRNGSTVPLKFEIFAGPTELTNTSYVQSLQAYQVSCTASGPEDPIETVSTGATSLRYDATSGQFIFNWQTPRRAGNCYKVVMTAQDGSDIEAFFKLK